MRRAISGLVPGAVLRAAGRLRDRANARRFAGKAPGEVFAEVYARGRWGGKGFHSGRGSHDARVMDPYVTAVRAFLESLGRKPDALDLGCGDFAIGARLRNLCAGYAAVDAVPALIEANRERHADLGVEFRVADITRDALPRGEVVFLRQVLQHLANADIAGVLTGLAGRRGWLVLTEHLPARRDFVANVDIATGPGIRLLQGSGVVITAPPFDFPAEGCVICDVPEPAIGGRVVTTLYELRPR